MITHRAGERPAGASFDRSPRPRAPPRRPHRTPGFARAARPATHRTRPAGRSTRDAASGSTAGGAWACGRRRSNAAEGGARLDRRAIEREHPGTETDDVIEPMKSGEAAPRDRSIFRTDSGALTHTQFERSNFAGSETPPEFERTTTPPVHRPPAAVASKTAPVRRSKSAIHSTPRRARRATGTSRTPVGRGSRAFAGRSSGRSGGGRVGRG